VKSQLSDYFFWSHLKHNIVKYYFFIFSENSSINNLFVVCKDFIFFQNVFYLYLV